MLLPQSLQLLLLLQAGADADAVRAAYKRLALQWWVMCGGGVLTGRR